MQVILNVSTYVNILWVYVNFNFENFRSVDNIFFEYFCFEVYIVHVACFTLSAQLYNRCVCLPIIVLTSELSTFLHGIHFQREHVFVALANLFSLTPSLLLFSKFFFFGDYLSINGFAGKFWSVKFSFFFSFISIIPISITGPTK